MNSKVCFRYSNKLLVFFSEILPLVEFTLADNIQLDEAMELIEAESLNEEKGTSFQQKVVSLTFKYGRNIRL